MRKISLIKFLIEDWCWVECRNNPCIIIIIQTGRTIILFNQKVVLRQYKRLGRIKRPANLGWTRGIDVNYAFAALRNPIWFWPQCMISRPIEANKLFFPATIFSSITPIILILSAGCLCFSSNIKRTSSQSSVAIGVNVKCTVNWVDKRNIWECEIKIPIVSKWVFGHLRPSQRCQGNKLSPPLPKNWMLKRKHW